MTKHFTIFEDVIADEDFLAWYHQPSSEQAMTWQQWLSEHPEYRPIVDEAVQYLNLITLTEKPISAEQTEAAHDRLMRSVSADTPVIEMKSRRSKWWLSAAAAVLLIIGGTALWSILKNDQLKIDTAYGQIAKHQLPDGSEVILNANSQLSMKESWSETGDREVWLDGEAFFHVKKTTAKNRFIVHANGMDIIVTGTQFNVVNREGESNVLLKEGSVTLRTKDGQLIKMLPGDYVRITNDQPQKEAAPEEKVLAWTQAKLVFENTSLANAASTISRHYGVKVTVEKDAAGKTLSGILPNDNLDVLLKALEAMDLQIIRKDKEIIISTSKP